MADDDEIRRLQQERRVKTGELAAFGAAENDGDERSRYASSIDVAGGAGDEDDFEPSSGLASFTAPQALLDALPGTAPEGDVFDEYREKNVGERESEYQKRRHNRPLGPDAVDAFSSKEQKGRRTYKEAMEEVILERQEKEVQIAVEKKLAERKQQEEAQQKAAKRSKWDVKPETDQQQEKPAEVKQQQSDWDDEGDSKTAVAAAPRRSRWDDKTPVVASGAVAGAAAAGGVTPRGKRSRWDETPQVASGMAGGIGATPMFAGETPIIAAGPGGAFRVAAEIEWRNRPFTEEELNSLLPMDGYRIVEPPANYKPIRSANRNLSATPSPYVASGGFQVAEAGVQAQQFGVVAEVEGLPIRPEDRQYFQKLIDGRTEEDAASVDEAKEIRIMRLLLAIKNGTPPMRKKAFRNISEQARNFGAGPLFAQILPLLLSPTLEEQERHLLVKTIDRVLYRLDDLVRPYVHKILVVIEPLLIDESYIARAEGREIISNLAKAAGLATMIATMRPDIDHQDEYVRNTTARAFAVVGSALGIPALLPFLKAVCRSKKSWQARHTGVKIIQQLAMLMGCAVLPHLKLLVECMAVPEGGLQDENQKVRTVTALALAALAEASAPYGIESFDPVLKDLYYGIRKHRGKGLAAFLKAIGYMLPLMDASIASVYVREVMVILIREFASPDDEMKRIVLRVVQQAVAAEGVTPQYVREEILPEFFKHFWTRRMALEKRNYREVVDTTIHVANKVGSAEVVGCICDMLKDESEPFRKMVAEAIHLTVQQLGTADVSVDLEKRLIDGLIYAFQEQIGDDSRVLVDAFGTVVTSLGERMKPYLPQLAGVLKWRLNNKMPKIRQHAALLIGQIAGVMAQQCDEEKLLGHLSVVLFEYLGEEYPDVLASILAALKAIVNVMGMERMQPPVRDLLPRLTPILRNRQEAVQENVVGLVGRIADRGGSFVVAKEWMRICYELLDLLKAHRKSIRRQAISAFGYIARAIGPADVLVTLLNNLKVQDRQNRICTTVAIAIVAEQCAPFTVLPGLMNEYKIPDLNVQNGILSKFFNFSCLCDCAIALAAGMAVRVLAQLSTFQALSFMMEYIQQMAGDYINAVTPLIEDALIDRDAVHRQTACTIVKHIAIGVHGLGCEDCLVHLLNFVFPNVFETSPHVIGAVLDAVEGISLAIGPARVLNFALPGLFHPARKVRAVYWKIYNHLYYNFQDKMVACFPSIPDEPPERTYQRSVLDIMI